MVTVAIWKKCHVYSSAHIDIHTLGLSQVLCPTMIDILIYDHDKQELQQ